MVWSAFFRVTLFVIFFLAIWQVDRIAADDYPARAWEGQEAEVLKQECIKAFREYRQNASLPEIPWDDTLALHIRIHVNGTNPHCGLGNVWRNGLSWGWLQTGNATTLCQGAPLNLLQFYAKYYQYAGERNPWDQCPGVQKGPTDVPAYDHDDQKESFGILFSNKIERFACAAAHCTAVGDDFQISLMQCATEPDFRDPYNGEPYREAFWKDHNYKAFCKNFPGWITGCDDAPNVPGCNYTGGTRTYILSSDYSKSGNAASVSDSDGNQSLNSNGSSGNGTHNQDTEAKNGDGDRNYGTVAMPEPFWITIIIIVLWKIVTE